MSMRKMRFAAAVAALFAVAAWTTSCSTSPTQPEHAKTVKILERPSTGRPAAPLEGSVYVTPTLGGTITLGNTEVGESSLTVPVGAVDEPVTITMSITTSGTIVADCGPSMEFNVPLDLSLSFKGADLTGIDTSSVQLYWIDPSEPELVVPSGVIGEDLVVEGQVTHFTQYSPGSEE